MASKKDKLGEAAKNQIEKAVGDSGGGIGGFVRDMRGDSASRAADKPDDTNILVSRPEPVQETVREETRAASSSRGKESPRMARSRESVYNVSSDIRLEDYTDDAGGGSRYTTIAKYGGIGVVAFLIIFGIYKLLFGPSFVLAVAGSEIDEANAKTVSDVEHVTVSPGAPVYIRFQWKAGDLKTDYLKVKIDRVGESGGKDDEEALLGRKTPKTANYIYYMLEPLDSGKYHVQVITRDGDTLREKDFAVE
ncbi:MAG: hypothetical protein HY042_02725 [Spirochaetia bacterium]|nr:hypothetical protein [Spirochaetia bacterium]